MIQRAVTAVFDALTRASISEASKQVILDELKDDVEVAPDRLADGKILLRSIEVEGLRGIGPPSKLSFELKRGLTLVVGANGCGKSSFAEAAERVLTGSTGRWNGAANDEQADWRNIHHGDRCAASLTWRGENEFGDCMTTNRWADGDQFLGGSAEIRRPDGSRNVWDPNSWKSAIDQYPPLLSYTALGVAIRAKPSQLFDVFDPLLGLGEIEQLDKRLGLQVSHFDDLLQALKKARVLAAEACSVAGVVELEAQAAGIVKGTAGPSIVQALIVDLELSDPFQKGVLALANLEPLDQDAVLELVMSLKSIDDELAELLTNDVKRAEQAIDLMRAAIAFRHVDLDEPCPVCRIGTLDEAWSRRAAKEVRLHDDRTTSWRFARVRRADATRQILLLVGPAEAIPIVGAIPDSELLSAATQSLLQSLTGATVDFDDLVDVVARCADLRLKARDAAVLSRDDRRTAIAPVSEAVALWAAADHQAAGATSSKRACADARQWLKATLSGLRADRLEAISGAALTTWSHLRQSSAVEMSPLQMKGTATSRRLELSCTIDGQGAAARSVLSQGELHALALSLFLPRATHPDSPFGFLLIDDPVQALDRRKVDGLAEVLATIGVTHQVIVFTHDDRLPDACERLGIDAEVLRINRGERSAVVVDADVDPSSRAIADARSLVRDKAIDAKIASRAVGGCCRTAVEERAVRAYRKAALHRHTSVADIDAMIESKQGFWDRVSLGVWGEVYSDASTRVAQRYGPPMKALLGALNAGGHELVNRNPEDLLRDTQGALVKMFPAP